MGRFKSASNKPLPDKAGVANSTALQPSTLVQWPKLKFKRSLTLAEAITDHIYIVRGVLDQSECDAFVKIAAERCIPTSGVPKRGEAFRNNARWSTIDDECARRLWVDAGMAKLLSSWRHSDGRAPVGLYENIRLYRYGPGQRFGKHYDDHFFDNKGRRTEYTLLVYLNAIGDERYCTSDRPSGGETVFYAGRMQPLSVKPEAGLALLHKHGADCLQHEALELHNSYKYVLRSDLVFA